MVGVITGDVVDSQKVSSPALWQNPLKNFFNTLGSTPEHWMIYRGDNFQLEVPVEKSLEVALHIKAIIKAVEKLDVRLSIGIGEKTYDSGTITESYGDAHIFSGKAFETLKDTNQRLILRSYWKDFDETMNLVLKLFLIIANHWSIPSSEVVKLILNNPRITQEEMANELAISQPSVNARLERAHIEEMLQLIEYFRKHIFKNIKEV